MVDQPDKMPIRVLTKDGEIEITPEAFRRLEMDLGNGATLWIEGPEVYRHLNSEPAARIKVMGGPQALAHFHPDTGNSIIATALKRTWEPKEEL